MKKYTLEEYNLAIELSKQGYGSVRIAKKLGHQSRSAVEEWINKGRKPYYFSEKRIQACSSAENKNRLREMSKRTLAKAVQISAELRRKKLSKKSQVLSKELAYVLGVCYGDGHISRVQRRTMLSATDKDFVLKFKLQLESWSGYACCFKTRSTKVPDYIKSRKVQYLCYLDGKEIANYLSEQNYTCVLEGTPEIKIAFLEGFFDSEGHITKHGSIIGYNIQMELILFVQGLLLSLGIESAIRSYSLSNNRLSKAKVIYQVVINGFINKELFYKTIKFSIKRKEDALKAYIQTKKMTENNTEKMVDNVIFVGEKPFMKS